MLCKWTVLDNGRFWCFVCDPEKTRTQGCDTRRWCGSQPDGLAYEPPTFQSVDAAQWFAARYAHLKLTSPPLADILARLEQCRSAGCDKLQDDICTASGHSQCAQRSHWFNMLAGGAVCQHWKPLQ